MSEGKKKDNSPTVTEQLITWLGLDSLLGGDSDIGDSYIPEADIKIKELEQKLAMTTDEDERKKIQSKIDAIERASIDKAHRPIKIQGKH